MKRRLLSILLALCMVLCLVPTAAMAVDDTAIPKDEDGTYLIYTVEQLKIFRDRVNIDERGAINVKLMADIDLNGSEDNQWTPIGNGGLASAYCGTFDGNGHTIKGLYINSDNEDRVGLFGYTVYPAVIHNLTVDGYVKGKDAVGGIVGYAYDTNISNCYNTGTISGNNYVGGIAGVVASTAISSCYNIGTVNSNNYVGGIAGATSSANISNCYYLTGTANNGGGGEAKSKEEFADGTVLGLLKGDRTDSPWAKCGYLNAAGMIVPLLKEQTSDTFPIYTAEDLKRFRDMVNGGSTDINAKLMNDIVLNDGTFDEDGNWSESDTPEQWTPIGTGSGPYAGTFDGGGHTIQGLYVKGASYAGLFGYIYQGTVKNVTVTGYVEGVYHVGGIVGYGIAATVTGCTNAATVKGGYSHVGGIVGKLYYEGNVRNCANLGSVRAQIDSERENACVGGIAGLVSFSATIADCYNAGSIAIQDSGTGKYTGSYLGGIIGKVTVLDLCDISNCYSVGSLTYRGSASAEIYGIAGDATGCAISNCYWLEGTSESGVGGSPYQTTDLTAHTKAEFADGTVLALLKDDRSDSPWTKCGYLNAAGMTLPLLDWQTADEHTHDYQWKYDDTEHWKECSCGFIEQGSKAAHFGTDDGDCTTAVECVCGYEITAAKSEHDWTAGWTAVRPGTTHEKACTNSGCGVTKTESCTGGTATCTEQATCEVCGEKYGEKDSTHHTGTQEWTQTASTHEKKWSCCGAEIIPTESHNWANGTCAQCGYGCRHTYEWQSENGQYWQKCKLCDFETGKKDIPTITITGSDKVCRTQDYTFSFTLPEGATDAEWGYEFINLADGPITPTLENGRYYGVMDSDYYSKSENSFRLIVSGVTADGFEFRTEKTVTVLDAHTGGTATCTEQATCEICGEKYGELDGDNHADMKHTEAIAATKTSEGNIEYWYCEGCGKYFADKDGNKEINKADTVMAKLPDDSKSPQTGDNSDLTLWIILLVVSGGAVTATTVYGRKKKRNAK